MNDEISRVLKMVEEGKIDAEQGVALIKAIETATESSDWIDLNDDNPPNADDIPDPDAPRKKPAWLHIVVDGGHGHHKKKKVRVRIPIKLAKWGLKFIPKSAQTEMKKEFGDDFELSQLSEILDELPVGEDFINVVDEEGGENVRIFLR